jgi:hypothetical protein
MKWWASQIDPATEAVVMENSAVAPEFQPLAARIIGPTLVVWTNCRPDHEEVWGPGREAAAAALMEGVPPGIPVAFGGDGDADANADVNANVNVNTRVKTMLEMRGNKILSPLPLPPEYGGLPRHLRENMKLAAAVCHAIGLPLDPSLRAMAALPPDVADFRVFQRGRNQLAAAFSANDAVSTARLFEDTGWLPEETTLLFHHRTDRPARLRAFIPWIDSLPWKRRIFTRNTGAYGFLPGAGIDWNDQIRDAASFQRFWDGQTFGCGNVAGWPLDFLLSRFLLSLDHQEV